MGPICRPRQLYLVNGFQWQEGLASAGPIPPAIQLRPNQGEQPVESVGSNEDGVFYLAGRDRAEGGSDLTTSDRRERIGRTEQVSAHR
jgi:hypothetical protein